jgi:ferredoxin
VSAVIERAALDALIGALRERGYTVVGPTLRSRSIVYGEVASSTDLPSGWQDAQEGGKYRLEPRGDAAIFGHNHGHARRWARARGRPVASHVLAEKIVDATAASMGRELDTVGIKDLLYGDLDHPRWDEVADRCLTCGNCTMVCPTCFCATVEDTSDAASVAGAASPGARWRSTSPRRPRQSAQTT